MAISAPALRRALLRLPLLAKDALALLALTPSVEAREWPALLKSLPEAAQEPALRAALDALQAEGALLTEGTRLRIAPEWLCATLQDAHQRGRLAEWLSTRRVETVGTLRAALTVAEPVQLAAALRDLDAALQTQGHGGWLSALGTAPSEAWLQQLPSEVLARYLERALAAALEGLVPLGDAVLQSAGASPRPELRARAAVVHALRGDSHAAESALEGSALGTNELAALGFVELTRGRMVPARERWVQARELSRGQRLFGEPLLLPFEWLLALCLEPYDLGLGAQVQSARLPWAAATRALERLQQLRTRGAIERIDLAADAHDSWLEMLIGSLIARWTAGEREACEPLAARAEAAGYYWVADELRAIEQEPAPSDRLVGLWVQRPAWELALRSLEQLASAQHGQSAPPADEIVWEVVPDPSGVTLELQARQLSERTRKGRLVALERLEHGVGLQLEPCDASLWLAISQARLRRASLPVRTLLWLLGDTRVRDADGHKLRLELRAPQLSVRVEGEALRLALSPQRYDEDGFAVQRAGDTLQIVQRSEVASHVSETFGAEGLLVPATGLERVAAVLAALASDVEIEAPELLTAGRELAPDNTLRLQLSRAGEGVRVAVRIAPGGEGAQRFVPGTGPERVLQAGPLGLSRISRELDAERAEEKALLAACPTLASLPLEAGLRHARDLETALSLLLELEALRGRSDAPKMVMEWRSGTSVLRAPRALGSAALRVELRGDAKWLELDGTVQIDEEQVVSLRALLDAAASQRGRYVQLGEAGFVALTDDLRARLDMLGAVSGLGKQGKIGGALLPAVGELVEGLEVTWAAKLSKLRDELREQAEQQPELPEGLRATLRDYQREGYGFLSKRSARGQGAVLADDMGLGKTVQSIALLLARAAGGPTLVIAPTSVARNWEQEIASFAPSLKVRRLDDHEDEDDEQLSGPQAERRKARRQRVVQRAGAGEVVLASYGLLVSSAELLAERRFHTVVFDEAHALKNAATRRWQAARSLQADALVALTGTPVENHVGELFALFEVIAPGLLGSKTMFQRAFAAPIARGDRAASHALRQIVRSQVLRRTKVEVLSELPPKTEMLRAVTPSREERAFYEAVRRQAHERLLALKERAKGGAKAGASRIEILSEITRLRRAAIDPRLVGGADAPEGAKLQSLLRLVHDLRAEGHRALIFSQFLEMLDLIQAALGRDGVRALRLDGSLTAGERGDVVAQFQAGQADVFLLSLRAGGVGMNLTAADYVLHVDPWWNPAVEDQATDRAHRLGQERPVTVVRLVTSGTIEEKVLALHGKKRALYQELVAGVDGSEVLDVEQLLGFLAPSEG